MKFIRTKDNGYLNPTKVKYFRVETSGRIARVMADDIVEREFEVKYPDFGAMLTAEEYEAKYKALDAENAAFAQRYLDRLIEDLEG